MMQSAFELVDEIRAARARAGGLLAGLDFDGTLAPIVRDPADAAMGADTRNALQALSGRADTHVAFVSGRAVADLEARCGLAGAWLVGNHGFEIRGPHIERVLPGAEAAVPLIGAIARTLSEQLRGIEGALVEDKTFTLSVHYRMVGESEVERVRDITIAATDGVGGVRRTEGHKVIEVRPDMDWNKGRAFEFLRSTLTQRSGDVPALFIGDDVTDEDAFRTLRTGEWPIIVATAVTRATAARAHLGSPDDVTRFLRALAD